MWNPIKKGAVLTALILCTGMPRIAWAWHGPGHMAIAVIAYRDLGKERAHKVADLLRQHPDYKLWMSEKPAGIDEDEYLFLRVSTWPDDIRAADHPSHKYHRSTWHFIDKIIAVSPNQPLPAPEQGTFIVDAMAQNTKDLLDAPDAPDRARALCWIFHLIGDIQQPLHAATLVSPEFPEGDRGGNAFWVTSSEGATNLHSFWDGLWDRETAFNKGANKLLRDLGPKDTDLMQIEPLAQRIVAKFKRGDLPELKETAFTAWVDESFRLAREKVYLNGDLRGSTGRQDAPALPASYEADARALGERRLALGGYRLADRLRDLLKL